MTGTEIDNIMEHDTCMQIYGTKRELKTVFCISTDKTFFHLVEMLFS